MFKGGPPNVPTQLFAIFAIWLAAKRQIQNSRKKE
jgi:hypothetical protein